MSEKPACMCTSDLKLNKTHILRAVMQGYHWDSKEDDIMLDSHEIHEVDPYI